MVVYTGRIVRTASGDVRVEWKKERGYPIELLKDWGNPRLAIEMGFVKFNRTTRKWERTGG